MMSKLCGLNQRINNLMRSNQKTFVWNPREVIESACRTSKGYACLILNCPIRIPQQIVKSIWENAVIRCTIDGGTNRWRTFLKTYCKNGSNLKVPDIVVGDFDSISDESCNYFNNGVTKFIHTPDQNYTDFTKAIDIVMPTLLSQELCDIIVFHETCGRFDQIMANINTLHLVKCNALNIYLLSCNSLTWLLQPGRHSIEIPPELVKQQGWCSLLPIGGPASNVTTKGLKWNLTNGLLSFGSLISTSNTYVSCLVEIETNSNLIWSMGVLTFAET